MSHTRLGRFPRLLLMALAAFVVGCGTGEPAEQASDTSAQPATTREVAPSVPSTTLPAETTTIPSPTTTTLPATTAANGTESSPSDHLRSMVDRWNEAAIEAGEESWVLVWFDVGRENAETAGLEQNLDGSLAPIQVSMQTYREGPLALSVAIGVPPDGDDGAIRDVFAVALQASIDGDGDVIPSAVDRLVAMSAPDSTETEFVELPGGAKAYAFAMPGGTVLTIEWSGS